MGGLVLLEDVFCWRPCLTVRHDSQEDIPLEDISKGEETCLSLRYIFLKDYLTEIHVLMEDIS